MSELLETARAAADAGARVALESFRSGDLEVREKSRNDFVTAVDRASEEAICGVLEARAPGDRILAEEGGFRGSADGRYEWIVDPLDGTSNYMQGLPIWGVSVACRREDEIVAAVTLDPLGGQSWEAERGAGLHWNGAPATASPRDGLDGAFVATGFPFRAKGALDPYLSLFREIFGRARSIRRCGAAVLDLAYTACGVYDGFFEFRLGPWDLAAGSLMIEEAGGVATDLDGGRRFLASGNLIAGGAAVHAALRTILARHATEADLERWVPLG